LLDPDFHCQEEEVRVSVLHLAFVQQRLHNFFASRLVGNAQRLVLDVRPQAPGVDFDRCLQNEEI
jgi:hypothetical protein